MQGGTRQGLQVSVLRFCKMGDTAGKVGGAWQQQQQQQQQDLSLSLYIYIIIIIIIIV